MSLFQQSRSILQPGAHRYQLVDDYWRPVEVESRHLVSQVTDRHEY